MPKLEKVALHAHDRIQERLKLPRESATEIQKAVDQMWFSYGRRKLHDTNYYAPIKDPDQCLQGYAAFTRVGQHPYSSRLILTTVLAKHMKPRGSNIGGFFNAKVQAICTPKVEQIGRFTKFDPIPGSAEV